MKLVGEREINGLNYVLFLACMLSSSRLPVAPDPESLMPSDLSVLCGHCTLAHIPLPPTPHILIHIYKQINFSSAEL